MWEIEAPMYFYGLLIIPFLVAAFAYQWWWRVQKQKQFADAPFLKILFPETSSFKFIFKFTVLVAAFFFLIIALVNPKIGTEINTVERQGVDIVFAMDISKSMLAEDMAPSRLEKSKQLVSKIIEELGTDRIGIVGYAGSAYPVLPITTDFGVAKMYLQDMNPDMVSSQGTALDQALQLSIRYFDNPKTSKIIILFSDGEDHGESFEDAVTLAKKKGIKIVTIGLGTLKGAKIPLKNGSQLVGYKKDKEGKEVITKLYPETLQKIANQTKGGYLFGNNTVAVTKFVKKQLASLAKSDMKSQQMAQYQSQFQWFLVIAFIILWLDLFFTEQKTQWIQRLGLFNVSKPKSDNL